MNNNATKNKLALNKTSLRDLSASEWELVGGGSADESYMCMSWGCTYTQGCSYQCYNDFTTTGTCACSATCNTDTCATAGCP